MEPCISCPGHPGSDLFDAWQKIKGLAAIYLPDIDMVALRLDINTLLGPTGPLARLKAGWDSILDLAKAVLPSIDSTTLSSAVDTLLGDEGPLYKLKSAWGTLTGLTTPTLPTVDSTSFTAHVEAALSSQGAIHKLKGAWGDVTSLKAPVMPGLDTTQLDVDVTAFTGPEGPVDSLSVALSQFSNLPPIKLPTLDDSQLLPFRAEGQPSLYDRIDSVKAALNSLRNLPDITLPGIKSTTLEADAAKATEAYASILKKHAEVAALAAITLPGVKAPEVPDMDVDVPLSLLPSIDTAALEGIDWEQEIGTALPALSERKAYQLGWARIGLPIQQALRRLIPDVALEVTGVSDQLSKLVRASDIPDATLSAAGTTVGNRMATALSRGLRFVGWTSLIVEGIWYGYKSNQAGREQAVKARLEGSTEAQAAAERVGRTVGEFTESWAKSGFDLVMGATDLTTWVVSWIPTWVAKVGEVKLNKDLFAGLADAQLWKDFGDHVQDSFLASGTHQRMLGASDYLRDLVGFTPEDVSAWFQGLVTSGMNLAGTAMTSDWFLNLLRPIGTGMTMAMPTIDLTAFETNWGGKALGSIKEGLGQAVADMTPDWVRNNWLFDLWDSISNAFTSFTTLKYEVTWGQRIGDAIKGALQKALDFLTPDWLETNFMADLWGRITGAFSGGGTTGGGGGTGIDLGSMNVLRPGRYGGHDQGVQRMYGDDGFGGLDLPGLKGLQGNSGLAAMRTGAGLGEPGAGVGEENPMLTAMKQSLEEVKAYIEGWGEEVDMTGLMKANLSEPVIAAMQEGMDAVMEQWQALYANLIGGDEAIVPMTTEAIRNAWASLLGQGDDAGEHTLIGMLHNFASAANAIIRQIGGAWQGLISQIMQAISMVDRAITALSSRFARVQRLYEKVLAAMQRMGRAAMSGMDGGGAGGTPNVVGRAAGGMVMKHEYTMVGEQGPELVKLPSGSRVYPTGMMPGGSTTNNTEYRVTVVKQPGEDTVDAFRRDMAFRKFESAGA